MVPELHERFLEQLRGVSPLVGQCSFPGLSQVNWSRTRLRPILAPNLFGRCRTGILGDYAMDVSFAISQRNRDPCLLIEALSRIKIFRLSIVDPKMPGTSKAGPW